MNPSELIDKRIQELGGWRGQLLARVRQLVREAVPGITEEWKWETPVWSSHGNVMAAGAFQDHLKLNFFRGALLADPAHLFNAGLDAKTSRAIDLYAGDDLQAAALRDLVRAAAALNAPAAKPPARPALKKAVSSSRKSAASASKAAFPKLPAPAGRALAGAGLKTLKQLSGHSETELLALHGVGPKAVRLLRTALKSAGLAFAKQPAPRRK